MGNLSNLYISESFYTVLHTGNDFTLSAELTDIQDGLGNSSGVSLNTNGDLSISGSFTSSLQEGYVWVGDDNNKTKLVSTGSFTATNATYAQNTITTGKNLHNTTIAKGTPLFFTGSGTSGNLVGVYPADAGNPDRMPAGGIAGESIAVGAEGIVLLDGYIGNVDTSQFASGDEVFVGVGGGYTNVAPTGSALIQHLGNVEKAAVNGSGVIQMMGEVRGLPNLTSGYAWVGDSNGVPQAVSTGSWGGGGGTIDTGSFATTGSNTFIGDQIISGSVDIKGQYGGSNSSRVIIDNDSGSITLWGRNDFIIWSTPVVIQGPGGDNGFEDSRISGISTIEANRISGSWGNVGNAAVFVGTGSPGITNADTGSTTNAAIKLQHNVNPSVQFPYNSWVSFPPTLSNGGTGSVDIRGGRITLQSTTGSQQTSVNVIGVVSASLFTGSFVGDLDGNALTSTTAVSASYAITASYALNSTTLNTSSLATTGSNTFVGDQFISGNLELSNGYVATFDVISGSSALLTGSLTVSQSTGLLNEFTFGNDGTVIYNWPDYGIFYRMQNGAFQFATSNGIGMVFDAAGLDLRNILYQDQRLSLSNSPGQFGSLNQTPYTGPLRGLFYNQTSNYDSPTIPVIGVKESSSFDNTAYIEMNLNVTGSATIGEVLSLTPQDPLPSGNIGDLAVSGSSLYFYNGSWTLVV